MCKMAHFGNCDPETAHQEYCIFHKPNKSEKEAKEFYRKFLERFEPRVEEIEVDGRKVKRLVFEKPVDARGFVFPEIPNEPIEYVDEEGNKWERRFSFERGIFKKSVDLSKAIFQNRTLMEFTKVLFEDHVDLFDITLHSGIDFSGSIFKQNVEMKVKPSVKGQLIFNNCHFKKELILIDSKLWVIEGDKLIHQGTLIFRRVNVDHFLLRNSRLLVMWISDGTFDKELSFQDTFVDQMNLTGSRINGHLELTNCHIGKLDFSEAYVGLSCDFNGTKFHGSSDFSATTFNGYVYFINTVFGGDVSFEGVSFHEPVTFEEKPETEEYKFYGELDFSHADIRKGINIDIPSEWFKLPEAEIEARRVQRLSYEKEGKRDEADKMFVLEMRAKRRARVKNAKNKWEKLKAQTHNLIEWLLADLPSEYGTNWIRLFMMSLLVIIGNAIPYTIWNDYIKGFPDTSNIIIRFANALYYSLVTFTTLGYGDMHPTGWLKIVSGLEALTGAVFMALIVAVIARKWMR